MKLRNKLEVQETLEVGVIPNTTTSNLSVVFETAGLFQRRQVGTIINKNENDYLPSISNAFPTSVFSFNVSTTNANPNLTVSFVNQVVGTVFAAPQSLNGTPVFRMLQDSDLSQTSLSGKQTQLINGLHTMVNTNKIDVSFDVNTPVKDKANNDRLLFGNTASTDVVIKGAVTGGDFKVKDSADADLLRVNGTNKVLYLPQLPSFQTTITPNIAIFDSSNGLWKHQLTIGDLITVSNINSYIPSAQNLSLGANAGQVNISGGTGVNLSSIGAINRPDANSNIYTGAGLQAFTNTTGSVNYPSALGGGISYIRSGATFLGAFDIWTNNTNDNKLYYKTGSSVTTYNGYEIVASESYVAQQITTAGGNYVAKTGDTITGAIDFNTAGGGMIAHNNLPIIHKGADGYIFAGIETADSTTKGVFIRPKGYTSVSNQTIFSSDGFIRTSIHGNSSQWKQAFDWGDFRDYGLGLSINTVMVTNADLINTTSFRVTGDTFVGSPFAGTNGANQGYLNTLSWGAGNLYKFQEHIPINSSIARRYRIKNNGVWGAWITGIDTNSLDTQATALGFIKSGSIPTVGNGQLSFTAPTGLSVSGTFNANQSGNTTIPLTWSTGYQGYTTVEATKLAGLSNYVLPIASTTVLGGVKVGTNLFIDANGVLSSVNTTYSGSVSIIQSGTSFQRAALTGDVTASQNSNVTTLSTPIKNNIDKGVEAYNSVSNLFGLLDNYYEYHDMSSGGTVSTVDVFFNQVNPFNASTPITILDHDLNGARLVLQSKPSGVVTYMGSFITRTGANVGSVTFEGKDKEYAWDANTSKWREVF